MCEDKIAPIKFCPILSIGSMKDGDITACIEDECMFWIPDSIPPGCILRQSFLGLARYMWENTTSDDPISKNRGLYRV